MCRSIATPASCAIAGTWSTVLLEQPSAISAVSALRNEAGVIMARAVIPLSNISITCIPARFARAMRRPVTAGIVPFPGSPRPSTSVRQFMLFAVNIPEHAPQPGQARSSSSLSCASSIFPAATAPTASNISLKLKPFAAYGFEESVTWPGIIGPPETTTVGRLRRAAAISMPGTILSQFGISTSASN